MKINRQLFYIAINIKAKQYDELVALSLGKIYWGWYKGEGLFFGWLDDNEALHSFADSSWIIPSS